MEYFFHIIEYLSGKIVSGLEGKSGESQDFIKIITDPFTSKIIKINIKTVLAKITEVRR